MFCFVFKSISNGKHMIRIIVKLAEMSYTVTDTSSLTTVRSPLIYIYIALSVILAVIYDDVTPSVVDANIVMENMVYLHQN